MDELVTNSIDAHCNKLILYYNSTVCSIKCVDNGIGMLYNDMVLVAQHHTSSKIHSTHQLHNDVRTLGFRGEALAAVSDIATVTIQSMPYRKYYDKRNKTNTNIYNEYKNTYVKTIQYAEHSAVQALSHDTVQHRDMVLYKHGTTVTVHGIFQHLLVRHKTMLNESNKYLNRLQQYIQRIALIHPKIQFTLIDSVHNNIVLNKTVSTTVEHSFEQLYHKQSADNLLTIPTDIKQYNQHYKITGTINQLTSYHTTRELQFLYVNKRIVQHKQINKLIEQMYERCSKVMTVSDDIFNKHNNIDTIEHNHNNKTHKQYNRIDRYPYYVINIQCRSNTFDILFEPNKRTIQFTETELLMHCIEYTYKQWLFQHYPHLRVKEHYLFPAKHRPSNNIRLAHIDNTDSIEQPFNTGITRSNDLLHPMFSTQRYTLCRNVQRYKAAPHTLAALLPDNYNVFDDLEQRKHKKQRIQQDTDNMVKAVKLIDEPSRMHCYCSDCIETGSHIYDSCQCCLCQINNNTSQHNNLTTTNTDTTTLNIHTNTTSTDTSTIQFVTDFINKRSHSSSQRICKTSEKQDTEISDVITPQLHTIPIQQCNHAENAALQITAQDLDNMVILSQIDRKFVIGMIDNTIIAIDQHAADERVKVEQLIGCIDSYLELNILPQPELVHVTSNELHAVSTCTELLRYQLMWC